MHAIQESTPQQKENPDFLAMYKWKTREKHKSSAKFKSRSIGTIGKLCVALLV